MPRVKIRARGKPEYIHTSLSASGGDLIDCHACGYTGEADLIKSNALGSGCLERCARCKSMNFSYKETIMPWTVDEWRGCYPSSWKGMIVPGAMSHPAKFSSKLIRRIYEHLRAEGCVKEGDRVIDPFGGVALGALDAMRLGLEWTGMELEVKFVDLGRANISNWDAKYHNMPKWGIARLVQGDSRKLLANLSPARAAYSSPPYAEMDLKYRRNGINENGRGQYERPSMADGDQNYGETEGQLGAMTDGNFAAAISSPPFRQSEGGTPEPKPNGTIDNKLYERHAAGNGRAEGYGGTDGQLANMGEGDFDSAVSSPPYNLPMSQSHNGKRGGTRGTTPSEDGAFVKYGNTEGQLEGMEYDDEKFKAAISSPPYEGEVVRARSSHLEAERTKAKGMDRTPGMTGDLLAQERYGVSEGQLGNDSGDDFWMAARQIVEQVYLALAPGGRAVWVVKDFVKKKERVPFSDQWRQLCEAVGFITLHEHRALLVHATSITLDGDRVEKASKSFFRRLAEKKGSPKINHETVWCMEKPMVLPMPAHYVGQE